MTYYSCHEYFLNLGLSLAQITVMFVGKINIELSQINYRKRNISTNKHDSCVNNDLNHLSMWLEVQFLTYAYGKKFGREGRTHLIYAYMFFDEN